jgi:hypothetical protein
MRSAHDPAEVSKLDTLTPSTPGGTGEVSNRPTVQHPPAEPAPTAPAGGPATSSAHAAIGQRLALYGVVLGALTISWSAQVAVLSALLGPTRATVFALMLDVATVLALHHVVSGAPGPTSRSVRRWAWAILLIAGCVSLAINVLDIIHLLRLHPDALPRVLAVVVGAVPVVLAGLVSHLVAITRPTRTTGVLAGLAARRRRTRTNGDAGSEADPTGPPASGGSSRTRTGDRKPAPRTGSRTETRTGPPRTDADPRPAPLAELRATVEAQFLAALRANPDFTPDYAAVIEHYGCSRSWAEKRLLAARTALHPDATPNSATDASARRPSAPQRLHLAPPPPAPLTDDESRTE